MQQDGLGDRQGMRMGPPCDEGLRWVVLRVCTDGAKGAIQSEPPCRHNFLQDSKAC